jgi:hypothetical protein
LLVGAEALGAVVGVVQVDTELVQALVVGVLQLKLY